MRLILTWHHYPADKSLKKRKGREPCHSYLRTKRPPLDHPPLISSSGVTISSTRASDRTTVNANGTCLELGRCRTQ
jgi:hypothetical protein